MNVKPKKTAEEMREYKLNWYHENKTLSGTHSNQNTGKTHCMHGHEFTEENTILKTQRGKEHRVCKICNRRDARVMSEFLRKNLDKLDPVRREKYLKRKRKGQLKRIGWTPERFDATFAEQDEKCCICGKVLNREKDHNHAVAHADHEHSDPPKPRGILCGNCNLGIGNLQENVEIMKAAISYVEKWSNLGA